MHCHHWVIQWVNGSRTCRYQNLWMLQSLIENDVVYRVGHPYLQVLNLQTWSTDSKTYSEGHILETSTCRWYEDGPERSAEPSVPGWNPCILFYSETTKQHFFLNTFHIEVISDYQNQCRNSTKLFHTPFTHFSKMLTFCTSISQTWKKEVNIGWAKCWKPWLCIFRVCDSTNIQWSHFRKCGDNCFGCLNYGLFG